MDARSVRSLCSPGRGVLPRRRPILCACILCPPQKKVRTDPSLLRRLPAYVAPPVLRMDNLAPRALCTLRNSVSTSKCARGSIRITIYYYIPGPDCLYMLWPWPWHVHRYIAWLVHASCCNIYTKKNFLCSQVCSDFYAASRRTPGCTDKYTT